MIVSASAVWKKFDIPDSIEAEVVPVPSREMREEIVYINGRSVEDGNVKIYATFSRPQTSDSIPAILLLPDLTTTDEEKKELSSYFVKQGYAVLIPDYAGKKVIEDKENEIDANSRHNYTEYPNSLSYANDEGENLLTISEGAFKTCWFEWTYTSLYALQYLKNREDISCCGVVGIRVGGEIAWKVMLSKDIKCGVPVNAIGWQTYRNSGKFFEGVETNLGDERRNYVAGIESQSYATLVKCPVLVLCSLHDESFDCDRAFDTYIRIGNRQGNSIFYSGNSGACIGPSGLSDMAFFLGKYLKGREVYIPKDLSIVLKDTDGGFTVSVDCDTDGTVEKIGVFHAETDDNTDTVFRDWKLVDEIDGREFSAGKNTVFISPFEGADYIFVYAYAKYVNGFYTVSKILGKKIKKREGAIKKKLICSVDDQTVCFGVDNFSQSSTGGIFLEKNLLPVVEEGYGKIKGIYSVIGIKTYRIGSPKYCADENAYMEFDAYAKQDVKIRISVGAKQGDGEIAVFDAYSSISGGGKWKRIILAAKDFKNSKTGMPLSGFTLGKTLAFSSDGDGVFEVTNILWL